MTPEEKARRSIDRQLEQCGWIIQDADEMNISAGVGVAIREYPLTTGEADYLLYVGGRAIGVVEAKPEDYTLKGFETQSMKYLMGLAEGVPSWGRPLPFHYESTGKITQFTSLLDPEPRSREVFTFHRPDELERLAGLERQHRALLRSMPPLLTERLWPVQIRAIENLEKSLAEDRPRALIQMIMGSGKTFTAVSAIYRLIKFARARRVLFLVDRTNLGRQALAEFQKYESPYSRFKFPEEFPVQLVRKNSIDPASRVCITTIQRLYSMLKGEPEFDEDNEERSSFEDEGTEPLTKEPLPVVYNDKIPIETFDYIVVDECHRSIYNLWRQVLEYFDAKVIGLTATPSKPTIGFFNNNLVTEYSHAEAVTDGVNVGYDVFSIRTKITQAGATLEAEPGFLVPRRDRRTRQRRLAELDANLQYTASQLDRDVVAEDQIRLVINTFRNRLFTELFLGRTEVPKTLVFAKDDSHAEDLTRIIREEFGRGNEFCQKITYRTGFILVTEQKTNEDGSIEDVKNWKKVADLKPEEVLKAFRNEFNPRIAVTVDMIATGTDVKPLECLLFMRNVTSANYFEQMKGRGSRVIEPEDLWKTSGEQDVRNRIEKDRFVIVDAVGVTESCKADSKPLDRKPSVSLDKVMDLVGKGVASYDVASAMAAKLGRLARQLSCDEKEEIATAAGGVGFMQLVGRLLDATDDDAQERRARDQFGIHDDQEPTPEQWELVEREMIAGALKPFHNPMLRKKILDIKRSHEQVIDEVSIDELLFAGFNASAKERAESLVTNFKTFIEHNREELEAIKFFYSRPHREGLKYADLKQLAAALARPPVSALPERVWAAFRVVEPEAVKGSWGKLVDVISLVQHAIDPSRAILPFSQTVDERYQTWLADQVAAGVTFTPEQRRWLEAIKDHIATSLRIEEDDFYEAPFAQFGGLGKAHELFGERLRSLLDDLNTRLAA
jgi:type I restriction enzyme, R subunit